MATRRSAGSSPRTEARAAEDPARVGPLCPEKSGTPRLRTAESSGRSVNDRIPRQRESRGRKSSSTCEGSKKHELRLEVQRGLLGMDVVVRANERARCAGREAS